MGGDRESSSDAPHAITAARGSELDNQPDEPPVVARMIVEIRSDGTRTIARGALEDTASGEKVAIEARGSTPAALAMSLARSMLSVPSLARQAVKALLVSKRGRG
jgi:hypothetical protein